MDNKEYKKKLKNKSEIFKVLGHPTRLCIVCKLLKTNLNVSQMQDCLLIPQSTVSQHLSILKARGIIEGERNGSEIFYSIVDEDVKKIVQIYFDKSEIPD